MFCVCEGLRNGVKIMRVPCSASARSFGKLVSRPRESLRGLLRGLIPVWGSFIKILLGRANGPQPLLEEAGRVSGISAPEPTP